MSSQLGDAELVRRLLLSCIPGVKDSLLRLERERVAIFGDIGVPTEVGAYSYVSEVFLDGFLVPVLRAEVVEPGLVQSGAFFIEELLCAGRDSLLELVRLRIVDRLLGFPELWLVFRDFAGVKLRRLVAGQAEYYDWPYSNSGPLG